MVHEYGRRPYLPDALASVRAQTLPRDRVEVLLFRDERASASDGDLAEGVQRVSDPRAELGAWVDRAIEVGTGDVFAFLDDDDRWVPSKLAWIASQFDGDRTLDFLHNGVRPIGPEGEPLPDLSAPGRRGAGQEIVRVEGPGRGRRELDQLWSAGAAFNLSSISVRRSLLERSRGPLRTVQGSVSAMLFAAGFCGAGSLLADPEPRTEFRVHPANLSSTGGRGADRWRREMRRAPVVARDCRTILGAIRDWQGPAALSQRIDYVRRRAELLQTVAGPSPRRAEILTRMAHYASLPTTWSQPEARTLLRLGLGAIIAPGVPAAHENQP